MRPLPVPASGETMPSRPDPSSLEEFFLPASRVVYTALFGGYEQLGEQPIAAGSGVRFICFTDDRSAQSDTWEIVYTEPRFPFDLVRSQRDIKIRGHELLAFADESLYIDNSVELRMSPNDILDSWLAGGDLVLSDHSSREAVIDEFDEVIALNYDDVGRVHEQLLHYSTLYPEVLSERPTWNGMIARRHTEAVARAMTTWFDHVLRYSRRDQLSANVAFHVSGVRVVRLGEDNNESPTHAWPVERGRDAGRTRISTSKTGPLLAEVARQDRELQRLAVELETRTTEAAATQVVLTGHVEQLQASIEQLREYYENSVSWSVTRPIRSLRAIFNRK
ncbi:glycosyltransferase domain-containing protein [Plantibacter sp. YIM 135249]|uniref:glycosyltransferase domain-containing protein n=1 Tax=Plantibacter sp. YIM 135249 TaxID=3423918 RepID=UPI003D327086